MTNQIAEKYAKHLPQNYKGHTSFRLTCGFVTPFSSGEYYFKGHKVWKTKHVRCCAEYSVEVEVEGVLKVVTKHTLKDMKTFLEGLEG